MKVEAWERASEAVRILAALVVPLLAGCTSPFGGSTVFLYADDLVEAFAPEGADLGVEVQHCANPVYSLDPPALEFIDYTVDEASPPARPPGVLVLKVQPALTGPGVAPSTGGDHTRVVLLGPEPVGVAGAVPGAPRLANVSLRGDDVLLDGVPLRAGDRATERHDYLVVRANASVAVQETLGFLHLGRVSPTVRTAVGCA